MAKSGKQKVTLIIQIGLSETLAWL